MPLPPLSVRVRPPLRSVRRPVDTGQDWSIRRLALFTAGPSGVVSVSSPLPRCSGPPAISPELPVNAQTLHKPGRFLDIDHTGPIKGEQFKSVTSPINRP